MAKLPADFVDTANRRYEEAKRFWHNWRGTARDDYAFIAGDQWLADDLAILKEQKRPSVVFNYSEKMIDAVVGAEVSARQEVKYLPREMTDAALAELWTNAVKWIRDEANVEDEDTDAFRDALICGLGWTHTRMNYEEDLDGKLETNRVDPLEMLPDPSANKPGLTDRRYVFRTFYIDETIAKRQWPDAILVGADDTDGEGTSGVVRHGQAYDETVDSDAEFDKHREQVQIRHYECIESEPVWRYAAGDEIKELTKQEFDAVRSELDNNGIKYIKQFKVKYWYAYFAGDTLLEGDVSPCQKGFTYQCITGKRDRNRNTWYGLTRVMKDPQRWANKWLSQILHIINSNAKGGLLAETGAFVDPTKAQEDWASPDSVVMLKEGGINKIKEKTMTSYPSGLDRLMEFALSSLPQVTGINLEALGLAGREQANVLEQSRKQAAYGLLAPVFDSLRRYRKNLGRVYLYFIQNYISDGRMIRIGGPETQKFLPLSKVPHAAEMDIIVDQAPTAPDVKSKTWEILSQLLPAVMKAGLPIPPDILKYTPLPVSMAMEWQAYIEQHSQMPNPQQMKQMQEENQQLKQKLADKSEEIQMKQMESKQKMALAQTEAQERIRIQRAQARIDAEVKAAQLQESMDQQALVNSAEHAKLTTEAIANLMEIISRLDAEDAAEKETT